MKTIWQILGAFRPSPFDMSTPDGRSRERYRRATLTSITSGLARITSVIVNLVSVPLTLHYFGVEQYGLWMTISAVIAFFSFSDLGISNGLQNGIAKANGLDDRNLARQYVSSAFFILSAISAAVGLALAICFQWIPWASFFRVHSTQAVKEAGPAVASFMLCFLLSIPANIVSRIQVGYQEGYIANLWTALGSVFSILGVLLTIHFHQTLSFLVLSVAGGPVLATLLNGIAEFRIRSSWLVPKVTYITANASRDLLRLAGLFFVLQVAGAISFSSDNIILARVLGPDAVTQYSVPSRLFGLSATAVSFIILPLWPAYGEALERDDRTWIRRTLYRSLLFATVAASILTITLIAFARRIIFVWVGPTIHLGTPLLWSLALWSVVYATSMPFAIFLNGLSIVRFQVILAIVGSLANIVLSIYLTHRIGISGVVWGSLISQITIVLIPYCWYIGRHMDLIVAPRDGTQSIVQ